MSKVPTGWVLLGVVLLIGMAVAASLAFRGGGEDSLPPVVVNVTVSRYDYEPGGEEPIRVPLDRNVVLRITSTDVTHGFAITEYGIHVEVAAGETVEVRFQAGKAGEFGIYCTVFCGSGHPDHKGSLHVG